MFKDLKKYQLFLLVLLILVASFFRLWQVRDYVVFLGDEGRDMMVMRNMLLTMRPVFLGPTASVGGFYLGPIYYWIAAPFLALSRFDPVGPSIMVAILGIATVLLLFKFLKEAVGFFPALLASSLYATAPLIVRYSRSSWNPNPLPFFALLMMYSLYLFHRTKKYFYVILFGAAFGISIQLHYLSVALVPLSAVVVVLNFRLKQWPKIIALSLLGFVIAFSPFLLFELRHGFPNFITIYEFVTRPSTHGYATYNFVDLAINHGNIFLENITQLKGTVVTRIIFLFLALGALFGFVKSLKSGNSRIYFSIGLVWFLGGLLVLKFYRGQIYDYYFGFMFPAPFFLLGLIFSIFWKNPLLRVIPIALTIVGLLWFAGNGFWRQKPNMLINQTETVAKFVVEKSEGKPFNFALISDHNSDHAYRYFLEVSGHKPTELETLVVQQLLIVCEARKCSPLGHPIWEIAGFGRAEVSAEWDMQNLGIKIFRLIHWSGAPSPAGKPAIKGV